jgi:hypothetical protein
LGPDRDLATTWHAPCSSRDDHGETTQGAIAMKKIPNHTASSAHLDLAAVTGGDDSIGRQMVTGAIRPKIWDELPKKPDQTTVEQPTK